VVGTVSGCPRCGQGSEPDPYGPCEPCRIELRATIADTLAARQRADDERVGVDWHELHLEMRPSLRTGDNRDDDGRDEYDPWLS
jgi:hypothetical protein